MKLSNEHKAVLVSYARHVLGAMLAVTATGNYQPDDLAKAALAAALPPLLRWANKSDPAFGRGPSKEA